jgi:hypothetical protein
MRKRCANCRRREEFRDEHLFSAGGTPSKPRCPPRNPPQTVDYTDSTIRCLKGTNSSENAPHMNPPAPF